ncbi:MAG: hypothetical protein LAN37_12700 [Acidobacteriia bacterium]|nr:hypothetical protein [Terriglobia bacterium]
MKHKMAWITSALLLLCISSPTQAAPPAKGYQYTVVWKEIPEVMKTASFHFTVPAIATEDSGVPLADVEILSNPCRVGFPKDPKPQIYAASRLHIYLNCPGMTKLGVTIVLQRLIGDLSAPPKKPGHYEFSGALVYLTTCGGLDGAVLCDQRYLTGGTLDIVRVGG